jgi:hypothetical protein
MAAAIVAAVAAIVLAVLALVQPLPDLTEEDARRFTANAFAAAGFPDGEVSRRVESAVYAEPGGDVEFDVWVTTIELGGRPVELWIDRDGSQAVQIDDNTEEGPLLDGEEFQILDDYDEHPRADERRRRNWLVTGVAVVVVAVAVGVIVVIWRRTSPSPSPAPPPETASELEPQTPPPAQES